MNNTTILKLLGLLEQDNKQEIKEILTHEMLQNTDKKTAKLYNIVKKYLKQVDKARPILMRIQHKNGKQFLCDGYTLHIFNTYQSELDTLPQTSEEESLNYPQIYNSNDYNFHEQSEEDKFIFANIKKYINYIKAQPNHDKKEIIPILYHNMLFNAEFLATAIDLHQNDLDTVKVAYDDKNKLAFKGEGVDSLIIPLRILNSEDLETHKQLLEDFKNKLK